MKINNDSGHINKSAIERNNLIPKEYLEVAKGIDTQFNEHLFQEMEKTIHREEEISTAHEIYNSLLNHERAKVMAEKNQGKGVQKLILNEILPKDTRFSK